ncbi:MAG: glycosyltransferase family 4 protein [Anaerolineae bacterium]|nr:glycosyltransferase family 4 protein [Anaerolineae bacterium]
MSRSLHIGIDASRSTVARSTGTERYSLQLIRHLIELNEEREFPHQLTLYFRDEPADDLFPESAYVNYRVIPFTRMWTHLRLSTALWQDRPDVTFVPAHTLPLAFPGKAVVTVHDLGYKYFPEAHEEGQRRYLDWATFHSANRAALVLSDSQATANDLTYFYETPQEKIRVVYPGVDPPERGNAFDLFDRYKIPYRYFLFIGTLQPRKNIERIVEAFKMWRRANHDKEVGLVFAGKPGWLFDEAWVDGVEDVHLTGYVDDLYKAALIRHAVALVFPSLYEGFGFPAIEAMQVGTPVIASNTSSLPELVGEAGMLVDPMDVRSIAAAMDLMTENELLRRKLSVKGLMQAKLFTWEAAARQALDAIEEAAAMPFVSAPKSPPPPPEPEE